MKRLLGVFLCFKLASCAAVDVSNDTEIITKSMSKLSNSLEEDLDARIEQDKTALRKAAAAANASWTLNPECTKVIAGDLQAAGNLKACDIQRSSGVKPAVNLLQSTDLKKKISTIDAYLNVLNTLATENSAGAVTKSITELRTSVKVLADATESDRLDDFAVRFEKYEPKVNATTSFLIRQRQVRLLQSIIRDNDEFVQDVVRESILELRDLGLATSFDKLANDLDTANRSGLKATNESERFEAMGQLEDALSEMKAKAPATLVGQLNAIARLHSALAKRLRGKATVEEMQTFLEDINNLKTILEED